MGRPETKPEEFTFALPTLSSKSNRASACIALLRAVVVREPGQKHCKRMESPHTDCLGLPLSPQNPSGLI